MQTKSEGRGKLIVLEGIDGSGKSTQYERLCEHLSAEGYSYRKVKFPRYGEDSSALIRQYLRGDFGSDPADVNPYAASVLYAVDRFASYMTDWKDYYNNGGLILLDRYTTSNACHQGSKVPPEGRQEFLDWLYGFEFRLLELPEPNLVLYLDTDIAVSGRQMVKRRSGTGEKADIHERNADYLAECLEAGHYAAEHYGWTVVHCVSGGNMRGIDDIHEEIYSKVKEVI